MHTLSSHHITKKEGFLVSAGLSPFHLTINNKTVAGVRQPCKATSKISQQISHMTHGTTWASYLLQESNIATVLFLKFREMNYLIASK